MAMQSLVEICIIVKKMSKDLNFSLSPKKKKNLKFFSFHEIHINTSVFLLGFTNNLFCKKLGLGDMAKNIISIF